LTFFSPIMLKNRKKDRRRGRRKNVWSLLRLKKLW
jgi:hypothetical protein